MVDKYVNEHHLWDVVLLYCIAVDLGSPENGKRQTDKSIIKLHTHKHIYIYMRVCVFIYMYMLVILCHQSIHIHSFQKTAKIIKKGYTHIQ